MVRAVSDKFMPEIISVNISKKKGVSKSPIKEGFFKKNWGLKGDVHASPGRRQVSLLTMEAINTFNQILPANMNKIKPGDFAENLTIEGIDLASVKPGTRLKTRNVILEVSLIGKKCPRPCAIYKKIGSCIMPTQGIFARVIKGGRIREGDEIQEEK